MVKKIILSASILVLILFYVNITRVSKDLSGNFTEKEIRQVKIGMTIEQVVDILGRPYEINSLAGLHNIGCINPNPMLEVSVNQQTNMRQVVDTTFSKTDFCCEGNRDDLSEKRATLVFTRNVKALGSYPMLWIHLDKDFRVREVYAKSYDGYFGIDDHTIYSLAKDGFFENKEEFENLF